MESRKVDQTTHFIVISYFPAHRMTDVVECNPNKAGKFLQQHLQRWENWDRVEGKEKPPGSALLSHSKKKTRKNWVEDASSCPPNWRKDRESSFLAVSQTQHLFPHWITHPFLVFVKDSSSSWSQITPNFPRFKSKSSFRSWSVPLNSKPLISTTRFIL